MVKASAVIDALNVQNQSADNVRPVSREKCLLIVETGEPIAQTCRIFRMFLDDIVFGGEVMLWGE